MAGVGDAPVPADAQAKSVIEKAMTFAGDRMDPAVHDQTQLLATMQPSAMSVVAKGLDTETGIQVIYQTLANLADLY
ncbi:TPA: hypothetical protein ACH3X3_015187 [Trebouxia sp. C0006]